MEIDFTELLQKLRQLIEYPLFSLGQDTQLTVLSLINLGLMLGAVLIISRIFRNYILSKALSRTRLDPGMQYTIGKIVGYLFVAAGIYIALTMVGINLSALAVLAGAVGVGIGFGLQNIVNNFISGLIILGERPITVGDRVEVGATAGLVRQINLRSTTVVTNDNISIIIPNSDFITNPVTNWSHGDPKVRLRLPFGVAYGSDVQLMKRVVIEMARLVPRVIPSPPPNVFFKGFGDSSLDFELAVWTAEATTAPMGFQSELYFGLEKTLRDHHIEIPFPQRDLHLRSGGLVTRPHPDRLGGTEATIQS